MISLGEAAHITAAAAEGPRFDITLTRTERRAAANGLWACRPHARLIDADSSGHSPALLLRWRAEAEGRARAVLAAGTEFLPDPLVLDMPWLDRVDDILSPADTRVQPVSVATELAELRAFLSGEEPVCWWLWTGPAGAGKTRLAVELCRSVQDTWDVGFLRVEHQQGLTGFDPVTPTLVVVDYAARRAEWLAAALTDQARGRRDRTVPLRVLALERDTEGGWLDRLQRTGRTDGPTIGSVRYRLPRSLYGLGAADARVLVGRVAAELGRTDLTRTDVEDIAEHALEVDNTGGPLSVFVATVDHLSLNGASAGRDEALRHMAARATDRLERGAGPVASPTGLHRARLAATALGGLTPAGYRSLVESAGLPPGLVPGVFELGESGDADVLPGLTPDLVGELSVLDSLAGNGVETEAARVLVAAAAGHDADAYAAFVERAARDHPEHPLLHGLLDAVESPDAWADLAVALVPLCRRSEHPVVSSVVAQLTEQARDGSDRARERLATAVFRRGNLLLGEKAVDRARSDYTEAIGMAEPAWTVHASALNNRGITMLNLGEPELAAQDFTAVLDSPAASDEAKACALNNRADIWQTLGDYERAVADRTTLLGLVRTTADRRFIALSRRAQERWALGDKAGTLSDFDQVLATDDIAVEQKMEARLLRAEVLRSLGRTAEAVADLRVVVASARNFEYVDVEAANMLETMGRA